METVKTGWLEKKSVMRWQKRWFALYRKRDSSRAWFAYFDGALDGVLDEARARQGAVELVGRQGRRAPGAGSRFQVILAKHALKCGAADDAARDAWMRALRSEASHAIDPNELVKKVGSGAYGCVASARDTSAEARERFGAPYDVAIKKVANVFEDAVDACVDAKRILREVRLMRNWNHPCVLGLYDIVEPSHSADFEDLYILYLFYQTLCGVHYINSAGVIHRDLKPANLLVDVKTCGLKVCDFGLSRCLSHEGAALTDGYIEAPAVDGGANNFTEYVLKIILKQLGKPTDPGDSWFVTNKSARQFLDGLPAYAAQPLDRKVPGAPPGALDLVLGMLRFDLCFDPRKRTPVSDCIDHACLADYREHELEARAGFHVEMDDVEAVALTKSAIQRLLYDDVRAFHRDLPADRGRVFSDAEERAEHVTIDHAATPMDQSPR
ncbi:MAP kinase [Aureococcus anophagefferens]|nr:MAP kinase [Aureococcus anophagefferens]